VLGRDFRSILDLGLEALEDGLVDRWAWHTPTFLTLLLKEAHARTSLVRGRTATYGYVEGRTRTPRDTGNRTADARYPADYRPRQPTDEDSGGI
jgi:hypothetical protein